MSEVSARMPRTPNVSEPVPGLVIAGQPMPDDLRGACEAGVEVVIDLRDPREYRPFDEPALVAELGMSYLNLPVGPAGLTEQILDEIMAALHRHAGQPVLVHCASGNRVCGALIPWFIHRCAMTEQEAAETAVKAGLRSQDLLISGLGYARNRPPEAGVEGPTSD